MESKAEPVVVHVFSHAVSPEPGQSLSDVVQGVGRFAPDPVKFTAQFLGSFNVYTRLETPLLADAQSFIAGPLWEVGIRSQASTELQVSRILGPKRASPDYCALVRVQAAGDPVALLNALDDTFEGKVDPDTYGYGAAVVSGRGFDLLVDLGRPSFEELKVAILEDLRGVDGIAGTDSSFAFLPGNAIRGGEDAG
jgi:hypothetical protein